ncbi:MAG: NADAR family protein [Hyphomicrobiaceae bacterium]
MLVQRRNAKLTLIPETEAERELLSDWQTALTDRLIEVAFDKAGTANLFPTAGHSERDAQINITFHAARPDWRLISNLAATPFDLDGRHYASIEGFWQGLKSPDEAERRRIAGLSGQSAKRAGSNVRLGDIIVYDGTEVRIGTVDHWALMERACRAKFDQCAPARDALIATAPRPLVHKVAVDSRTIPGIVMADIWTRIRADILACSDGD